MIGIDESGMFEFMLEVQRAIHEGWTFKEIKYGERRLDIGPELI